MRTGGGSREEEEEGLVALARWSSSSRCWLRLERLQCLRVGVQLVRSSSTRSASAARRPSGVHGSQPLPPCSLRRSFPRFRSCSNIRLSHSHAHVFVATLSCLSRTVNRATFT